MTYRVGNANDAREVDAMLSGNGRGSMVGSYQIGSSYGPERFRMGRWPNRGGRGRMVGYAEIGDDDMGDGGGDESPMVQNAQTVAYGDALARTHTLVRDREPTKSRMYVIGIGTGLDTIDPAATATLSIQPQVLFRPERIVVDATDANFFLILDFKVGKNSQFAAQSPLPASAFQPQSFGVRLKCDTCQISAQLVLQVQNKTTTTASTFNACIFGEAVE